MPGACKAEAARLGRPISRFIVLVPMDPTAISNHIRATPARPTLTILGDPFFAGYSEHAGQLGLYELLVLPSWQVVFVMFRNWHVKCWARGFF